MSRDPPITDLSVARELALHEAGLAAAGRVDAFDRLTRLAVELTGARAAFVGLAGGRQAWFQSAAGLSAPFGALPEDADTVCRRVMQARRTVVLPDALADPDYRATWEVRALDLRALVAVPLVLPEGVELGAFVLVEMAPRAWSRTDIHVVERLAATCVAEIQDRRTAEAFARADLARAERELQESEARFRRFVELAPDALFVVTDDRVAYANASAVALSGARSTEDVVGRRLDALLSLPYLKRVQQQILGGEDVALPVPERFRRVDGTLLEVEVASLAFLYDERPGVLVFVRDLTARRRAEHALAEREVQLRLVLEQLPVAIWSTDAELRLTSASGGPRVRPHPVGARVGELLEELFGRDGATDPPQLAHVRALAGQTNRYRIQWGERLFDVVVAPLLDAEGEVAGTAAAASDVTEQARVEERRRESAELEALGRVAGGVAHEMNNILATILGVASMREADATLSPGVRADLVRICGASRRGATIVASLLGFARKGMVRRERVHLGRVLADVGEQLRRQAPPGVELRVEGEERVPEVEGDRPQLEQSLLELGLNALAAVGAGGQVVLRGAEATLARAEGELPAGRYARIEVADTGVGMSEEVRVRALEPFFTTRPLGQGVGLGLSMAYGVAAHHQGSLSIASEPGRGTTVTLLLPAAPMPVVPQARPSAPPAPAPPSGTRGTVLVVDDDEWVRESARVMLEHLGYAVLEAESGEQALEAQARHAGPFTYVFLDMRMPGMGGEEALRRLLAVEPQQRVVLCSGYEREHVSQALFDLGRVDFLAKPFGLQDLTALVGAAPLVEA